MEFAWSVNKVTVAKDNLVVKVDFTVIATEGENTASAAYSRELTRGDNFTPYDQLTESQVLAWCFEPIVITWRGEGDVNQTATRLIKDEGEAQVSGQIARKLAEKVTEPDLPWVKI